MKFNELKLEKNILKALKEAGYSEPTPIQQQAIPPVLEGRDLDGLRPDRHGQDLCVCSADHPAPGKERGQKGHHPCAHPHADARELALQIYENVPVRTLHAAVRRSSSAAYRRCRRSRRSNAVWIFSLPRRAVCGIWMGQKIVKLDKAEFFVLDEADRMLDMGFFPDVKRIVKFLPKKRQTLLFGDHSGQRLPIWQRKCCMSRSIPGNAERKTGGQDRAAALFCRKAGKEGNSLAGYHPSKQCTPGSGVHPHQARRRPGRARPQL